MRHDQLKVFELRKQGKTYREIERLLGISRSTLCDWFKDKEWSKHIKKSNTDKHIKISTEHLLKMNEGRRTMLEEKYKKVEEDAEKEFEIYKNNSLFMAGLMLYAGEGDKLDKGTIRLANIDFNLHKIFIKFCEKFLKVDKREIKFSILLYPDLDINLCIHKWSTELTIQEKNFYKPQVIQGKLQTRKLHFGVGTTIILNSFLKRKLLFWIEKSKIFLT
ncbi:MAG: helix-turn-helix domain-containing protein [Candidatus Paceibacterota bacterium]|jgi:hypothetical protein